MAALDQPLAQRRSAPPIKAYAAAMGITQTRFSQQTGLPYRLVHRVFNSSLAPGPEFRRLAEKFFGVPASELFHAERSSPPGKLTRRRKAKR